MKELNPYRSLVVNISIIAIAVLTSCSATRSLQEDEYLLLKNKIIFQEKNPGVDKDALLSIAKPKPNKKFLGLARVKLYLYQLGTNGRQESNFRTWLRDKAGERPSLYDTTTSLHSVKEMMLYLNKTGYFYSDVTFNRRYVRKKKVKVDYMISLTRPYRLSSVEYAIEDTAIMHYIQMSKTDPKIKPGAVYNAFKLDDERDRITDILQNNGYYYFNRDYIFFEVDSATGNRSMSINVKIKPNVVTSIDEPWKTISLPHRRYFIHNIYIRTNYDPLSTIEYPPDTIRYFYSVRKGIQIPGDYYFLQYPAERIHSRTIIQSIFIKPGDPYRLIDITKTRSRIAELGLFSYSIIRFKPLQEKDSALTGLLDCNIDLSIRKLHSFTVETEATNSGGRPGIGLNFTYSNSNIFRGSETLRLKAKGALEAQQIFGNDAAYNKGTPFFNTIETGIEASIIFPRFLIPVSQERFPRYFRPKTTLSIGVGYESRPEYTRLLTNLSFGYDWKEPDRIRHQIFPFDWSIINVNLSPEFEQDLEDEPNDRIKYQYTDNLITAIRYTFTYNTQDIRKIQNFFYFRGGVETAGNLLRLGSNVFNAKTDSLGHYIIFGIPYANYLKVDGDFRFFNVITRNNSAAYRFYVGTGIPYGNATVLPLEKGFYGGGSNGMRGWSYRLLGPGSYNDPSDNFDRMGDIQLEANLEIRFPVYNFIKSALFADIGNIWLMNSDESYPGGEFRFNRFYKEFAIDVGIGIRLDFNFFIMRVDFAIPLRDPSQQEGARWVLNQWQISDFIINFGIGYPF